MLSPLYTPIESLKSSEKCIIISTLQLRKPNLREVKLLLQDTQISSGAGIQPQAHLFPKLAAFLLCS